MTNSLHSILEAHLGDTSGVYVNQGVNETDYYLGLAASIREHLCEPFQVSAKVMPPGFPDREVGDVVTGFCLARHAGYWLVFSPAQARFYCFWGTDAANLGAHGVYGSPLYCWSA